MTRCQFCLEVGYGHKHQCPYCGSWLAHYVPTMKEIREQAAQIRYESEVRRLTDPHQADTHLPWERTQA